MLGMLWPDAIFFFFFLEMLCKYEAWARWFLWKSLGGPTSWVGYGCRKSRGWGKQWLTDYWRLRYGTGLLALLGDGSERNNVLCQYFCLGESWSSPHSLIPDNSVPPCKFLVPLELLAQCWSSEQVSLSKSMCRSFTKTPGRPSSHFVTIPTSFYSQKLWGISFGYQSPGMELLILE